ncbi:hypothetical protein [Brevibacterium aurantiacum]|uniref:Uncharacterized protein n=1 Tax=Brevibacterium aurantiacum TaxID=273384 RepID=A0A556C4Y7_BREAU|nr:hypothetical protein [Brevibacterium aurantiacum]TSI12078.1 hypothetical protein FO013_21100 [Brevibacterium aurantiacum]
MDERITELRLTFTGHLVSMFFPGACFILVSGLLSEAFPSLALGMGFVGFFVLIAWPIFTIVVHVRHDRRLRRQQKRRISDHRSITEPQVSASEVPINDSLFTFVSGVEAVIMMFALPIILLGGIGVFCLVTLNDDPGTTIVKGVAGAASLGLLGGYLFMLMRGRTPSTLRIVGIAVAVFGIAGLIAVGTVLRSDGLTNLGDVIMAVTSVVMIAAGMWLAITGCNSFIRTG